MSGRYGTGKGSFSGRGGFGGINLLPIGSTYADIQSMSREATALYPVWYRIFLTIEFSFISQRSPIQPLDPLPVFTEYSKDESRIGQLQIGFASRLRKSQYYVVEVTKSTGVISFSKFLTQPTNRWTRTSPLL